MHLEALCFLSAVAAAVASVLPQSSYSLQHRSDANETEALEAYAKRTYLYAGGQYVNTTQEPLINKIALYMVGQIYVEKLIPYEVKHKTPLVFIAGAGQTSTVRTPPLSSLHYWHPNKSIRIGSTRPTAARDGHPSSSAEATPSISPTKHNADTPRGSSATASSPNSLQLRSKSSSRLRRTSPRTRRQLTTRNGRARAE